jgi:putative ABC transport system permease protein
MNIWKRGFLAVIRKPIKSILLIAVIYCITVLVMIGISAGHTSTQAQLEARNQVGASFLLRLDMEDFRHRISQLETEGYDLTVIPPPPASPMELTAPPNFEFMTLLLEDIEKLAQVDGIENYNIQAMMNFQVKAVDFERIEGDFPNDTDEPIVTLVGVRELSLMPIVRDGSIILTQGRWIEANDSDKLVISEELAVLNQLEIGDKLMLETIPMEDIMMLEVMERFGFVEPELVQIQGEIVGIFQNNRSIAFNPGVISQRSENQIFSNLNFPKVGIHENDPFYEIATFHVENVNQFDEVRARLEAVEINWDRYELLDNQDTVAELTPAFEQLQQTGSLLLSVVLVSSFGILFLVFVFLIRGRNHEIGIWLSLGHTKQVIIFQMIWEGLLVSIGAFLLSFVTIPFVLSGAESYFNAQAIPIVTAVEDLPAGERISLPEDIDEDEPIRLVVTANTMILTTSMTSILIIFSIALATIPILRLKPREIFAIMS